MIRMPLKKQIMWVSEGFVDTAVILFSKCSYTNELLFKFVGQLSDLFIFFPNMMYILSKKFIKKITSLLYEPLLL